VDILDFEEEGNQQKQIRTRKGVHLLFSLVLVGVILIIKSLNDDSVIDALFQLAGYTYGPLLGMYAFGLFTKWNVQDKWVPLLAIVSPFTTYYINIHSEAWFNYVFSFELLILNGALTFVGLLLLRVSK
jgi:ABC-type multidrug transport system permease subunit